MTPPIRSRGVAGRLLTRVAATLALLIVVVGVPLLLAIVAPLGWPEASPTWEQIRTAIMQPDDGRLALGAMRLVAWGAWAAFVWAVAAESVAAIRGRDSRRILALGGFQRLAATLVGAAILTVASPTPDSTAAPAAHSHVATAVPVAGTSATPPVSVPRADPAVPADTVTVRSGDSLWAIAKEHLDDGERWHELFAINAGRRQPDGRALTDPGEIDVGWELALPDAPPHDDAATATEAHEVTVAPGDSLSSIAATHLGDPNRYTELFALNAGVEQPDGDMLTDPDVIRPGWVLALPEPPTREPAGQVTAPVSVPSLPQLSAAPPIPHPRGPAADPLAAEPQPAAPTPGRSPGTPTEERASYRQSDLDRAADPTTAADEPADTSQRLYLGLTALGAAGLVGELTRRRLLQRRTRRTGESVPRPPAGSPADNAERVMRAALTPLTLAQIRTTLDVLCEACFTAERDLPRIAAVEVGPELMTLHLTEDDVSAVGPFTPTDTPRRWSAPTAVLAKLERPDTDTLAPEPYPALVALGHTATSTVLLNLEAAGTLRVLGEPGASTAVIRATVAELATSELSARAGIVASGEFAPLARACAPSRLQANSRDGQRLAARTSDIRAALTNAGLDDTLQARSDRTAPDLWLPVIYTNDDPGAICQPWSGAALVTRADGPAGWHLTVNADGSATLSELDLQLRVARLSIEGLREVTELLTSARLSTSAGREAVAPPARDEAAAALAGLPPTEPSPTTNGTERGMHIGVLGPVRLTNLPEGQPYPTPQKVELLVFLALRGPSGIEIDEALWPGQRGKEQARYQVAHKARMCVTELNLPAGRRNQPLALSPHVTCDWDDFRRLATRGLEAGSAGVDDLAAALALVRGRPLSGVESGAYGWADREVDSMVAAITDVAHTLARRLIKSGDARAALSAATTALSIDPVSDRLCDDAIAAALAYGDLAQATRIKQRHDALIAELEEAFA